MAAANSPSLIHVWLGAIWAGGIPAAVNPELTASEIDYLREDLGPAVTLLNGEVEALQSTVTESDTPAAAVEPLEVAAIVYTSGTTSRPKGVMVRHAAYTETGASFPGWMGLKSPQRLFVCLPLFHINAQAYSLMTALVHGFAVALPPKFHASTFWRDAHALGVTSVNVVGAMLEFLAKQPEGTWVESALRARTAAGAARSARGSVPGPHPDRLWDE